MRLPITLVTLVTLTACGSSVKLGDGPDDTGPPAATAPIYVHSADTLYTWDPDDAEPMSVGAFHDRESGEAPGTFADIAIDAAGALYGAVGGALYRIDPTDAATDPWGSLPDGGTGLTFLPDGRLLVAGAALTAVDLDDGATETLYPAGTWSTSGDVVAVPDGTVHWSCAGASGDDWVVFDPGDGTATRLGAVGASNLWGVAYARDRLYGFDASGVIWEIDGDTGAGAEVQSTSVSFYGATTNPIEW